VTRQKEPLKHVRAKLRRRVPGTQCSEDDGSDDQVEATCALTLVLEAAVAQVTLPIEENGKGGSVPGLALVEAGLNTPAQLRDFHPLQHESERSMRPTSRSAVETPYRRLILAA
jgi:hypothetical protein